MLTKHSMPCGQSLSVGIDSVTHRMPATPHHLPLDRVVLVPASSRCSRSKCPPALPLYTPVVSGGCSSGAAAAAELDLPHFKLSKHDVSQDLSCLDWSLLQAALSELSAVVVIDIERLGPFIASSATWRYCFLC